jgi:outer membrane protein OmpA-like peptidoglycan-associated protein
MQKKIGLIAFVLINFCFLQACKCQNIKDISDPLNYQDESELKAQPEYPKIVFTQNQTLLNYKMKRELKSIATSIKTKPTEGIVIELHSNPTKKAQSLAIVRAKIMVKYLVEILGISDDRIAYNTIINADEQGIASIYVRK